VRLTIERLRTLVLAAGVLLVGTLVAFLAVGKWKNPFNWRDLPQRMGIDIQQEANGWTYTHALRGHTLYKIHASKLIQLTKDKGGRVLLHDVQIELYGEDGSRVDRIEGNEFEYDQKSGTAKATGPVEITLMRPAVAPAIAPKATPGQGVSDKVKGKPLATAAETAASGEIHVKTSGLTFDEKTRVAATSEKVDFSLAQGSGSAVGATFDSQQGLLVLDRAVQLTTQHGRQTVNIHAQHAEFERDEQVCRLRSALAAYRGGEAAAGEAKIQFRGDGSPVRLDAANGFTLTTATGSHLAAPRGSMDFDERSQPRHGHLEGGVTMDSATRNVTQSRKLRGISPSVELEFTSRGELRHAHLERGVEFDSEEVSETAGAGKVGPLRVSRGWRSPVADVEFRNARRGQVEPATIHGTHGVVVRGESQRGNEAAVPSRLAADDVSGQFGPGSVLAAMTGTGHAVMEETSASGTRQTSSGDRLEAHFSSASETGAKSGQGGASQLQSATVDGHVVLIEEPAAKPGAQPQAPRRAVAGRAVYEGAGEWLHLTLSPRVDEGGLHLTADKIDVSEDSGDAFAHGNVKATWTDMGPGQGEPGRGNPERPRPAGQSSVAFGGPGPAHVVSSEAQLHQGTGEATFKGHARLWQQASSISAPVIVLDRQRQTLTAHSADAAEPVRAVMVTAAGPEPGRGPSRDAAGKSAAPSVIRVRGGDLKYSDAEHKAVMRGGALGTVVAETGAETSVSNEVELVLLPPGNHAGKDGGAAQVDRMTARGRVTVSSQGRRGTGEQLAYSSETGEYVLTGTAAAPPRMTDPGQGTVTGEALIFHSRDDSVSVEGGERKTTTETTSPK
jgi:lipopolysaccharide export system protein LptA